MIFDVKLSGLLCEKQSN